MRYTGEKSVLYMSTDDSSSVAVPIETTEWSLDLDQAEIDQTCQRDTNQVASKGLPKYSGSFSAIFNDADRTIFKAAAAKRVKMYCYPSTDCASLYVGGLAWVAIGSVKTDPKGNISVSGKFGAGGNWAGTLSS